MEINHKLKIILSLIAAASLIVLLCLIYFCRKKPPKDESREMGRFKRKEEDELEPEDLICFQGCENLTIQDLLDAPGEIIGKSSYGTLYKASLQSINSVALLRFLRPASTWKMKENLPAIKMLGFIRHPNLVPLQAFYSGPRGEKLLVHPFFIRGTLAQFLLDGKSHKWAVIYSISLGIVKGLDHLHTGLEKSIIHGNLKSKNILLDGNYQAYVSDFGLHLLLNSTGQEILEASAAQGYKAPELIKIKDVSKESDIYSLGVILLEILTRKEPINDNPSPHQDLYLPNCMRNAIIDHRISDMVHPDILLSQSNNPNPISEESLLRFVQLALACCSPSPSLRPDTKQVLGKLKEIGR